jgi:hypothetical protein
VIVINSCNKAKDFSDEWVLTITLVAILIADNKTPSEINIWGTTLTQLGDTLATIAAIREANSKDTGNNAGTGAVTT